MHRRGAHATVGVSRKPGGHPVSVHLLSAHAAIGLAIAFVLFVVGVLVGLHVLVALGIALVIATVLVLGPLARTADRLEHWMTTMR